MEHVRHLLSICEDGNVQAVEQILDKAVVDVNCANSDDVTPFHVAAANGHDELVRLLLMRGAALDKANIYGWTPLLLACRHGHLGTLALLLQNKADINARTKLGANALILAARGGHLQTCKMLVEAGIDLNPNTGIGGSPCEFSPLMVAAHLGHDAVARQLLDRGFDVNYRTPSMGVNSLMLAGQNGHMTTCQILVEHGADPNHTNVNDHTPLQIAAIRGKREVQGYLERKTTNKPKVAPEDVKPDIIEAAKAGDIQRIRDILDDDLTQRDVCSPQDGATPLMFASMSGRLVVAQLLVESGCDVNKQDTVSGWTALMQATYHGKKLVAKYLINAGADVLVPAKNGCTAFDMASLIGDVDTELYRLLAARAVQINRPPDRKGSKNWSTGKPNGNAVAPAGVEQRTEEDQKGGLKAWWNRMSNRFHNLKLGRTFSLNSNRLAPLPVEPPGDGGGNDATLKGNTSPRPSQGSPQRSGLAPKEGGMPSTSTTTMSTMMSSMSMTTSYDTILLETQKTASRYTLGLNSPNTIIQDSTLKPVIPPFLPPPTFDTDRPKMPPVSTRRSITALGSTSTNIPPVKLLQSCSTSVQNMVVNSPSPTTPTKFLHSNNASPSSSTGASALSGANKSQVSSSASSSTLTAGSDNLNKSGCSYVDHHPPVRPPPSFLVAHTSSSYPSRAHMLARSYISSSSMNSYSSSSSRPQSRAKSGSSKSNSTLTPSSPSPTTKKTSSSHGSNDGSSQPSLVQSIGIAPVEETDELGGLLKKLSLEMYQPIFEEQEVDMEAFLTLSDQDLKELGISYSEPRHQILSAITQLNSGKGRERRHLQETMTDFESTMKSRSSFSPSKYDSKGLVAWGLTNTQNLDSSTGDKSRSS